MDNEVAAIFGTELDINISFPKNTLGRGLISVAHCRWQRNIQVWKRTVTSTLKMALMRDDFPEPLCGTKINLGDIRLSAACAHLPHNENSESMEDI